MRTGTQTTKHRIISLVALIALVISAAGFLPPVYAANDDITLSQSGPASGYEDKSATLKVSLHNNTASDIADIAVTADSTDFYISDPDQTVTLPAGGDITVSFKIDLDGVTSGYYTLPIIAEWSEGVAELTASVRVRYQEVVEETYDPAVKVSHTFDSDSGIIAGKTNTLTLAVQNKGDSSLKTLEVTLSSLPEGLTLDNASTTALIGGLGIGNTDEVEFPILADEDMESGSYPIGITVTGKDAGSNAFSFAQTIYVPVKASGSQFLSDVDITGISAPSNVLTGEDFTLTFSVANNGDGALQNIKVSAIGGDGVINKTKNIFIQPSISAGGSAEFSITYYIPAKSEEKYYPIEIAVQPASGANAADSAVSQYTGVYAYPASGSKTPRLIVDNYSYGGSFVQAGDNIDLALTLFNTSGQDLQNIKVTLASEDGTFVPFNSSNSFYLEGIAKKSRISRDLTLSVKPNAEQKTSAIILRMTYEDKSGNSFDSEDVISIPVMQETRLVVDDIVAPPDLFAGQPMSVSVQFYNMGKTILNNLRITAEGNFTATESTSYYVGNMDPGKNDYYDFGFTPNEPGQMTGTLTFSFEDQAGNAQTLVKEFVFDVMEMPPMPDDQGGMPPEETGSGKLPYIIGGVIAAAAVAGALIFRRIRKKRRQKAMEFTDE